MKRAQRLAREAADEVERETGGKPRWMSFASSHIETMCQAETLAAVVKDAGEWVVVCGDHGEAARVATWGEVMARRYAHLRVWHDRTS
jgi:hypothetical protein